MEYAVIVQARTGSTRLPGKMTTKFYSDKVLLEVILERILLVVPKNNLVLATTTNISDDVICDIANKLKIRCFRGSELNVLDRFIKAAELCETNNIIRICADNPFLNLDDIELLIKELISNTTDYISFKFASRIPTIKSHIGLYAEGVKLNALRRVQDKEVDNFYKEHVTNYIYEHKDEFELKFIDVPNIVENNTNIRLTIDTQEDFDLLKHIYKNVGNYKSLEELFNFINSNSEFLDIMKKQIIKNTK